MGQLGIASPELIELATGRKPNAGVLAALAEGKAVTYDPCLRSSDGTLALVANLTDPTTMPAEGAVAAPGTTNYDWNLPRVFVTRETAAAHGWTPFTGSMAITYPAPSDLDAVHRAAEDAGVDLFAAEPVSDGYLTGLYYLMAGLAALVAVLGAGVTVALSAADGRDDLAVLAALGAQPRRRRMLAGAHALVVTLLGTVAGLAIGVCAGVAAVPIMGLSNLAVPWQHLLLTALAVPLLASAMAVVATPSRLPMMARS